MEFGQQIDNRELAHVMALAEHPLRCLAKAATEAGLETEAESAVKKANKGGVQAGKTYLIGLMDIIDLQEKEILQDERIVRATYEDFSRHLFYVRGRPSRDVATRAWNAIAHGQRVFDQNGMKDVLVLGEESRHNLALDVVAINLSEDVLCVLPNLPNCGKLSQDFINDFYESRLPESSSASAE